jgi:hypothetical protein
MKMAKNKLYTKSYFKKRIVEQGFDIIDLKIPYEKNDLRKWTLVVNKTKSNYKMNIIITCFKDETTKEFCFKFQGQRKKEFLLETLSMKLIIDILKKTTDETVGEDINE